MKRIPRIAVAFALVQVAVHLLTANNLGFHRDEFLYLSLGRHLDWGYWSNGPLIGVISGLSRLLLGDSLVATRVFPALAGGMVVLFSGLMVRDWGGGRFAQVLNGTVMLCSLAWLRAFGMLQPVAFDILFWTLMSWGLFKWLQTNDMRWWWWIGVFAGAGFLNKYSVGFWALALPLAFLPVSRRTVLASRYPWQAVLLAVAIILPNIWWQWRYHFPVVGHMRELASSQLVHVQPLNFLLDQLLMHGPGGALVWVSGLVFLFRAKEMAPFRLLAWHYVAVLVIFLLLNGKSYYTLGLYPALIAAGAVSWERLVSGIWLRVALPALVVLLAIPLLPGGIPLWPAERLKNYFHWLTYDAGIDALVRWEDGELHDLPQDYADMLGWNELAALADTAFARAGDPNTVLVYCENYGQAGAVEQLGSPAIRPRLVSFADAYRLRVKEQLPGQLNTLIYVNDELGDDVANLFADVQKIGEITNPLAREQGTGVWLCRSPRANLSDFWAKRVGEIKALYGLP